MNVDDPNGTTPSDNQPLDRLGVLELLLLPQAHDSGREGNLVILGYLVRLDRLLVDPLGPALPDASHGFPLVGLRPVDVTNALPGVLGVGAVEMELRAHNLDSMLVEPHDVLAREGPLDGADGALA